MLSPPRFTAIGRSALPDRPSTEALLQHCAQVLNSARRADASTRAAKAPSFNALRFLRTDEHGLSRILADVLDPDGSHGQGAAFLEEFLRLVWPEHSVKAQGATVTVESRTDRITANRRRLDIRLQFGRTGVLGIENKAWDAVDQPGQVGAYLEQLSREHVNHRLIYLTRYDSEPPHPDSLGSIDPGSRLLCLGFRDLVPWLERCAAQARNERVRSFLVDFTTFIETDMRSTVPADDQLIVSTALDSAEATDAALELLAAGDAIKSALLQRFVGWLRARVESSRIDPIWKLTSDNDLTVRHAGIALHAPGYRYGLRVDFYGRGANDVSVGVHSWGHLRHGDEGTVREAVVPALGIFSAAEGWPWYRAFPRFPSWGHSLDAMRAVADPSDSGMAAYACELFESLYTDLKNAGALESLR